MNRLISRDTYILKKFHLRVLNNSVIQHTNPIWSTTRFLSSNAKKKKLIKQNIFELSKIYDPSLVEKDWYQYWEEQGLFTPQFEKDGKIKKEGLFCIPAPPPNVTGALHIGHALTVSLEDSMARFYRMKGKTVLFVPGFDHAGIATQSIVEKAIWKKEGKLKLDYTREQFIEKLWNWKELYHSRIKSQFKRLGGSYDWSREAFTLDDIRSKAVNEAFIRLFEEGIIYRDMKLVNWSSKLKTSISNLEVDTIDVKGKTLLKVPNYEKPIKFGVLYYIAYEIIDSPTSEKIVVATSRPETIFGDVAIAIHPDDERYKHLHGCFVKHPFLNKKLPIVSDKLCVDIEFGTGAVKITPAHDENDYFVGRRNNLPIVNILSDDGCLNENTGTDWEGMPRFEARSVIIEKLKERQLFVKEEEYSTSIPVCSRSGDIIEPLLKSQWWISQTAMAKDAIKRVRNKEIKIQPTTAESDYFKWLENIKDWCISRQLWWGHRCPVYFIDLEDGESDKNQSKYWVAAANMEDAKIKAKKKFPSQRFDLKQDEDVLDTWFSSALWPLSTLAWPSPNKSLSQFYPYSILESGWDILFFWITRMILLTTKLTGIIPFKEVFCHPLVRDAQGRKMSKSLGNVIDPIDVINGTTLLELQNKLKKGNLPNKEIELMTKLQKKSFPNGIPRLGADALRFTLCSFTSNSNSCDINLDLKKIEENKRFINKIYQAVRFLLLHSKETMYNDSDKTLQLIDKWVRCQLIHTSNRINDYFEQRNFMGVTNELYQFWYLICDNYIEYVKFVLSKGTLEECKIAIKNLQYIIDNALCLLHPIMPFVTEELWQLLPNRTERDISISVAPYPSFKEINNNNNNDNITKNPDNIIGNEIWSVIQNIRSLCELYGIREKGIVKISTRNKDLLQQLNNNTRDKTTIIEMIKHLTYPKIDTIIVEETINERKSTDWVNKYIDSRVSISISLKNQVQDIRNTVKKYCKKIEKLKQKLTTLERTIMTESYKNNVSEKIKKINNQRINDLKAEIDTYQETVNKLQNIL